MKRISGFCMFCHYDQIKIIKNSCLCVTFSLIALSLLLLTTVSFTTFAFAETTYFIKMPLGSSDPGAPYFWSERSTGNTTGEISIFPNDSITWENADTAFHTITSVTQSGEIDGIFDSGFIDAGDSYTIV